jgi:hypothetical protein
MGSTSIPTHSKTAPGSLSPVQLVAKPDKVCVIPVHAAVCSGSTGRIATELVVAIVTRRVVGLYVRE